MKQWYWNLCWASSVEVVTITKLQQWLVAFKSEGKKDENNRKGKWLGSVVTLSLQLGGEVLLEPLLGQECWGGDDSKVQAMIGGYQEKMKDDVAVHSPIGNKWTWVQRWQCPHYRSFQPPSDWCNRAPRRWNTQRTAPPQMTTLLWWGSKWLSLSDHWRGNRHFFFFNQRRQLKGIKKKESGKKSTTNSSY